MALPIQPARWATFDCYGTLIDWNLGIRTELERIFGVERAPRLLERYHELEPEIESEPFRSYHEVLTLALERLAQDEQIQIPEGEATLSPLPAGLAAVCRGPRGARRASCAGLDARPPLQHRPRPDRRLAAAAWSADRPRDRRGGRQLVQTRPAHWERFFEVTTAQRERHVHVAASLFHDIAPARELGLRSVWINRLAEQAEPEPDRELPDLAALPDTLDELVPA